MLQRSRTLPRRGALKLILASPTVAILSAACAPVSPPVSPTVATAQVATPATPVAAPTGSQPATPRAQAKTADQPRSGGILRSGVVGDPPG